MLLVFAMHELFQPSELAPLVLRGLTSISAPYSIYHVVSTLERCVIFRAQRERVPETQVQEIAWKRTKPMAINGRWSLSGQAGRFVVVRD